MSSEVKSAGAELRAQLGQPVFNQILKKWVGKGELDYEVYLRTPELLGLQFSAEERVTRDELMFQIVHQSQELWLKLLSHELAEVIDALALDAVWDASARLERASRIALCLAQELTVIETLTPDEYQRIRRYLGNGSGQESPGFNHVQLSTRAVGQALEGFLARRGLALRAVYLEPGAEEVKRLCEQILDVDEHLQSWLVKHFMLVRRTIGVGRSVPALDGVPTQVLTGRMTKPFFPALWEVRAEMTAAWVRDGGVSPHERWKQAVRESV